MEFEHLRRRAGRLGIDGCGIRFDTVLQRRGKYRKRACVREISKTCLMQNQLALWFGREVVGVGLRCALCSFI